MKLTGLFSLVLLTCLGLRAETLFNNLTNGIAFSSPYATNLGRPAVRLATPFVPNATAPLGSISLSMAVHEGIEPPASSYLRISIVNDSNGGPGTNILETFMDGGYTWYIASIHTLQSSTHPVLHASNQYWVTAELTVPGYVIGWTTTLSNQTDRAVDVGSGWVVDGANQYSLRVESAPHTLNDLIALVINSELPENRKRPLLASLNAADRSFERGNCKAGRNQLKAFRHKLRAQIRRIDAALAEQWDEIAGGISTAPCQDQRPGKK